VCLVRLAGDHAVRQARDACSKDSLQDSVRAQLDGYPAYKEPEHVKQEDQPSARERALDLPSIGNARFEYGLNSIELGSTCPTFPVDTRSAMRMQGVVLSERDRDRARRLVESAAACGTTWRRWRSWRDGDGYGWDLRLVAQTHCGTRHCESCSERIRRRQSARCAGDWRMFTTHTIPRVFGSGREVWDHAYDAARVMRREVRRESAKRSEPCKAKTARGWAAWETRRRLASERISGPDKIEYAWAIEPHKDGYPHLHCVWNLEWIDYGWLRDVWSRALGVMDARIDGRAVWSEDGVCRYLSKYISKRVMTLDILAIIKGRRTWATSVRDDEKVEPKWWPDDEYSDVDAVVQIAEREDFGAEEGWSIVSGRDGGYALWKRPADIANALECVYAPRVWTRMEMRALESWWSEGGGIAELARGQSRGTGKEEGGDGVKKVAA